MPSGSSLTATKALLVGPSGPSEPTRVMRPAASSSRLATLEYASGKLAKEIFPKMFGTSEAPAVIMEKEGLKQISDTGALEKVIEQVIAANPKQVEQYRGGKSTVINFLVGQAMKATRGQANVAAVTELFKQKLG